MDDRHSDPEKLPIRCPGCGQRFKVGLELKDRMVECGTCEHRFRVNDEVVVRQKKFYPGERRDTSLERFSRVPKGTPLPSNFQTIQYSPDPVQSDVQPASPVRLVFGFVAVAAVVIVALILAFGGSPGGMLDGAAQSKRLALAGFTALIAAIFLIAANPRARMQAIFGAIVSAALLLSLPFIFTEGNKPVEAAEGLDGESSPGNHGGDKSFPSAGENIDGLKNEIGCEPLEREIAKLADNPATAGRSAAGVWLREVREYQKRQIESYIERVTGADPDSSHMYPRTGGYLMVVSGVTEDLAELARLCERFGEVKRIIDPLRVIEVTVDDRKFVEGDFKKLTDREDPAYYELNRRELESIDLERAKNAVIRLAEAEPRLYRTDIIRRMQQLLKEADPQTTLGGELQAGIGRALMVWGQEGDGSEAVVRKALEKISATEVPESLVKFLSIRKDVEAIPFVDALWVVDLTKWEELYGDFGPAIEDKVLAHFSNGTLSMKRSAARLLAKNGTAKSLPVLEAARANADPELGVLIDKALAAIRERN